MNTNTLKASPPKQQALILILISAVTLAAHISRLADIPSGLYLDESSIGYNAFLPAETGRDEHGALLRVT